MTPCYCAACPGAATSWSMCMHALKDGAWWLGVGVAPELRVSFSSGVGVAPEFCVSFSSGGRIQRKLATRAGKGAFSPAQFCHTTHV